MGACIEFVGGCTGDVTSTAERTEIKAAAEKSLKARYRSILGFVLRGIVWVRLFCEFEVSHLAIVFCLMDDTERTGLLFTPETLPCRAKTAFQ